MSVYAKPLSTDVVSRTDNTMVLSMGPQHPSTHGVLQIVLEIDGESVVKADPEIGYLHTGIEKTAEGLFWTQAQTAIERMDYLAPESNSLCYALGVEKILGITDRIPERAQVVRVLIAELTRIAYAALIRDDRAGALDLYRKALAEFPDDGVCRTLVERLAA